MRTNIDWRRVAAPQEDGYDTEIVLDFIKQSQAYNQSFKTYRHEERPEGFAFDGQVGINKVTDYTMDRFTDAPADHSNIKKAADLLNVWPAVYRQFPKIVHTIHPWIDKTIEGNSLGSCSHSLDHLLGVIYATVNNEHGLAQAYVHEMAHNKLRLLGVMLESTNRFIMNGPTELFESPVRKDRKRPMTAVFHAQYSFMHCTALNVLHLDQTQSVAENNVWMVFLKNNLPRMLEGDALLKRCLKLDKEGELLFEGFFDWSDQILKRGAYLLSQENGN
ncbi:hypothetical protein BFP97_00775 [Roseivirga sp. 4D4]|uniref:aKG-HExxH-type peptide beta-hydroxylase n=1 Tax=Roseivirga sp. 4D4 TaxID=1889784 RepID=UPI000853E747|nr:HEXXH motif-containing putative peptide modification protein [Roseivirga sp. 4D4]OEK00136.1 hypothetical protein BFP97_00775 [Roseivirga sp. 4D4]